MEIFKKKKNKSKKGAIPAVIISILAIIGVVAIVLVLMSKYGGSTNTVGLSVAPTQTNAQNNQIQQKLTLTEDVTAVFSALDATDNSISVNGNHQYIICNADDGKCGAIKTVANAGTDTVSPGDKIKVLFGQGNASGSVVYLNDYQTFNAPDRGRFEMTGLLYRNGTVTIEVFNEEGNLIDGSGENETLAAGDSPTLTHKIKGTDDRGQYKFGGCMIVEYNTTSYESSEVSYNGVSTKISTPSWYTVSSTANTAKTYTVPSFIEGAVIQGTITPKVKSGQEPVGTGTGHDIIQTLVPNEWRFNGDKGEFELFKCQEDQDGNRIANPIDSLGFTLNVD